MEQHQAAEIDRDPFEAMDIGRTECRQRNRVRGEPHRDGNPHGVHEDGRQIARQQARREHSRRRNPGPDTMKEGEGAACRTRRS